MCTLFWTNGWNLTKLAQIQYWLDFGDLILFSRSHQFLHHFFYWKNKQTSFHTIFLDSGWNFTKLAQIHYKYREKKWLFFGYLDFIFKVIQTLWNPSLDNK